MSPRGLAAWPPWALLLLWLPGPSVRASGPGLCLSGCDPLRGPSMVTGTVGMSLSVQCHYDRKLKDNNKSWCKKSVVFCYDVVKSDDSNREVRSGRTSLSDHPANLSFTVTIQRLTLQDAGSYQCQVDTSWLEGLDPSFGVEVTVLPAPPTTETRASVTTAETLTTATQAQAAPPTSLATASAAPDPSSQNLHHRRGPKLLVLLLLLALLLLLLVGSSLLVWRRLQNRVKAGEHSGASQSLRQAAESEPHYAELKLQTWSLRDEPAPPWWAEVEYSTVACAREDLHYASVAFDGQKQDSHANGAPAQRPPAEVPEYSVIRMPRAQEG